DRQITDRVCHIVRLSVMTRNQLGPILRDLRELTFEGFGDSGMKRTSRLAQQRAVSRIPYQYMLERVGRVRRVTPPEQQTSPNETVQRRLQLRLRLAHDRRQQGMGELASDRRPRRRQPPAGAQAGKAEQSTWRAGWRGPPVPAKERRRRPAVLRPRSLPPAPPLSSLRRIGGCRPYAR